MINIYDVAERAGVSSATVSRVINGYPHVREETKKKVRAAIEALDYTPNALARKLSTGESLNFGFLIPDMENPFFVQLMKGITNAADAHGYNVFFYHSNDNIEKEHRFFRVLREERLMGLIVVPIESGNEETCKRLQEFEESGVPVVLVDRDLDHCRMDGVFSEDFEGTRRGVKLLVEAGHEKIAIIRGPESSMPGRERWEGFVAAMREANLLIREEYVKMGDFHRDRAYAAMKELMELPVPPTAVFSSNNMTSIGCLHYLSNAQLQLGADVSMVGFDDLDFLSCTNIPLTVIDRDVVQMGREAIDLLISYGKNREGKRARKQIFLPTKIILRGSEKLRGFKN